MKPLLTRRDRAALRLAYECLRSDCARDEYGTPQLRSMLRALDIGGVVAGMLHGAQRYYEPWAVETRQDRARYALTLRALLRADAEDCGPWRWAACGHMAEHEPDDDCAGIARARVTGYATANGDGSFTYEYRCDECGSRAVGIVQTRYFGSVANLALCTRRIRPLWEQCRTRR